MARQKTDPLRGTLDMLVLKARSAGAMHGYGVGRRTERPAEEMLRVLGAEREGRRRPLPAVGRVMQAA